MSNEPVFDPEFEAMGMVIKHAEENINFFIDGLKDGCASLQFQSDAKFTGDSIADIKDAKRVLLENVLRRVNEELEKVTGEKR